MAERELDIGAAIRARRAQLGWSQQLAAERVGLSVEGYARIERGLRVPGIDTFVRICRGLGTSPNALLGWPTLEDATTPEDLEPVRKDVVERVAELDAEALRVLQHVASFAWDRRR